MQKKTIEKYEGILDDIIESGLSISNYFKKQGKSANTFYVQMNNIAKGAIEDIEVRERFLRKYKIAKENSRKSAENLPEKEEIIEEVETDDKAETSYVRDDEGKIRFYKYQIFRKNKAPLSGKLTREEMNTIYRLYSYYGDALTQRIISRHFVDLSLIDFKRILRAFNITKASAPFAPHMIEECTEDELREIQLREKENSFLRKAEEDQIKNNEKLLKKYAKENIELKEQATQRKELLEYLLSHNININSEIVNNSDPENTDIIIVLSDLHIGAFNEKFGYIKLEEYTENEINRRLNKIISSLWGEYDSITVLNLGDSVDSYDKQTTRGGHDLPSVISNKEQSLLYQKIMTGFFAKLTGFSKKINYICVGESNHDGDWGWINNIVLSHTIKEKFNINSYISNNPIDSFNIQDCSFVYLHGKDNKNQFKNFPLTINDKTETWFNNYFLDSDKKFNSKKYILKGDLHQYAYTRAKHFDYISAPSLYGSSNWITANFGKTPWGALLIEINNNNIRTELIND